MHQQLGVLGTISVFAYRHRETKKNLCRGDALADLNGLVRFAKRRNLISARVPSHFKRSLPTTNVRCITSQKCADLNCASNSTLKIENLLARNSQQIQPKYWQICIKTTEGGGRDTDRGVRKPSNYFLASICATVCVQHTILTAITIPPNTKKLAQPYVVPRTKHVRNKPHEAIYTLHSQYPVGDFYDTQSSVGLQIEM